MKYGLADVLASSQAKLLKCSALGEGELALSVDSKKYYGCFGDDPAQVLFGVA